MSIPDREVTIYDVAKKLNLSAATISRALTDHYSVNKLTKQRVIETAKSMGYRLNHQASNLRKRKSNTIGIIVGNMNSSFMSDVMTGVEKVVSAAGYNLIISQSIDNVAKEINIAHSMYNNRVDGLLVSLSYETKNADHFESFIQRGTPLVYFDRVWPHPQCPGVEIDNTRAGYTVTEHLIKQGCKRIACITAFMLNSIAAERFNGYKQALLDYNIPFDEELVLLTQLTLEAGREAAQTILNMANRPDGVFVTKDVCAVGCMRALIENGIQIPHDIAFAGFNNDTEAQIIEPPLTTIDYRGHEMGETAARILIDRLHHQESSSAMRTIQPADLVIRKSSLKTA
jgi:LacI family transcriptional regulator